MFNRHIATMSHTNLFFAPQSAVPRELKFGCTACANENVDIEWDDVEIPEQHGLDYWQLLCVLLEYRI